jgi:cell division protein FtsB
MKGFVIAFLFSFSLSLFALISDDGLPAYFRLKRAVVELEQKIKDIEAENEELEEKIKLIKKGDRSFIEKLVREKLGWIKDGEVVVKFK